MIPNPKIYACRMLHRDEVMSSQSTSLRGEFGKLEQDPVKSRLQNRALGTLDSFMSYFYAGYTVNSLLNFSV